MADSPVPAIRVTLLIDSFTALRVGDTSAMRPAVSSWFTVGGFSEIAFGFG